MQQPGKKVSAREGMYRRNGVSACRRKPKQSVRMDRRSNPKVRSNRTGTKIIGLARQVTSQISNLDLRRYADTFCRMDVRLQTR